MTKQCTVVLTVKDGDVQGRRSEREPPADQTGQIDEQRFSESQASEGGERNEQEWSSSANEDGRAKQSSSPWRYFVYLISEIGEAVWIEEGRQQTRQAKEMMGQCGVLCQARKHAETERPAFALGVLHRQNRREVGR